jgi:hypothetical protein
MDDGSPLGGRPLPWAWAWAWAGPLVAAIHFSASQSVSPHDWRLQKAIASCLQSHLLTCLDPLWQVLSGSGYKTWFLPAPNSFHEKWEKWLLTTVAGSEGAGSSRSLVWLLVIFESGAAERGLEERRQSYMHIICHQQLANISKSHPISNQRNKE